MDFHASTRMFNRNKEFYVKAIVSAKETGLPLSTEVVLVKKRKIRDAEEHTIKLLKRRFSEYEDFKHLTIEVKVIESGVYK